MITDSEVEVVQGYLQTLYALAKERKRIEQKMESLENTIRSVLSLHDEQDVAPYLEQLEANVHPEGFTDAVRKVLRTANKALSPTDVKEGLPQIGFSLAGYTNPLASIHTILKRLAKTADVETFVGKDGTAKYRWIGPRIKPGDIAAAMKKLG